MRAIWTIAVKDLRLLFRERVACFFAFIFPLIVAIFFGMVFSGAGSGGGGGEDDQKIDILLVDEDNTEGSRAFAKTLREASELKITDANSRDEAIADVRAGKHAAFIALPRGFGQTREGMFWSSGTTLALGVDPSRKAEQGMLEGLLTKYGFMQMQEGFKDPSKMQAQVRKSLDRMRSTPDMAPADRAVFDRFFNDLDTFLGAMPKADNAAPSSAETSAAASSVAAGGSAWQPIKIEHISVLPPKKEPEAAPQSSFAITFPQGIIWGVMGCALGFSVSLVSERTRGTLVRLRVAPISPGQIVMGKALACFLSTQVVSFLLIFIGVVAFGVRPTSWLILALAIICTGVCFVGIMMLLAVLAPSERGGAGLGWGVLLVLSMIGGGMIPLMFLRSWMKTASIVSPIRWAVMALEGGVWRGSSLAQVALPCAVLLAIGVLGFAIGARAFRGSRLS